MSTLTASQVLAQATALHRAGRFTEAIRGYEQVLRASRNNATALDLLGVAQNSLGMTSEGRRNIERAIKLSPKSAQFHHDLSLTYKREGNFAQSHACLDKAIRLDPAKPSYRAAKSELHFMAGEVDKAMEALAPVLDRRPVDGAVASMFGTVALRAKRQREAIDLLRAAFERADVAPALRMRMWFVLGALHDSVEEYDLAFDAYRRGNELYHGRFDAARNAERVTAAIGAWTRDALKALPATTVDASRMIFVLGMPRSGSTMVEQIVAEAPGVHAAGELEHLLRIARELEGGDRIGFPILTRAADLSVHELERAGNTYMEAIRALRVGDSRVIDKMPLNFLALGLIQAALPGARVIHCRRDAADTCLSCYFQLFDGNLPFAYDLEKAGRFYREYERLMAHWKSVLSIPILDVQYEELVADQEGVSRRIYEFLELPWTERALSFHESQRIALTRSNAQVRQPIYTRSVLRHRHYEKHLAPLYAALGIESGG
ncbi:MAG TPA: sulfotransferase [Phycisphaerales bacterium]|nr:sulfotransferase [Phycisphaerales bacterium]HMP37357.1 sulfotransferase [Phycisphaerales bacterium]